MFLPPAPAECLVETLGTHLGLLSPYCPPPLISPMKGKHTDCSAIQLKPPCPEVCRSSSCLIFHTHADKSLSVGRWILSLQLLSCHLIISCLDTGFLYQPVLPLHFHPVTGYFFVCCLSFSVQWEPPCPFMTREHVLVHRGPIGCEHSGKRRRQTEDTVLGQGHLCSLVLSGGDSYSLHSKAAEFPTEGRLEATRKLSCCHLDPRICVASVQLWGASVNL